MTQYDPFDLAGQQDIHESKALKGKLAAETEEGDIKWLMSSKRGRRIVWRLLVQSEVFQPVFHPTAMVMSFREGKRNYGLQMLTMVNDHCPELYPLMMKENTHGRNDGSDRPNQ